MKNYFKNKRAWFIFLIVILITGSLFVWQKYPFSVKKFMTIKIGMDAIEKSGTPTFWAPPDDKVPESNFYAYSIGDESMCIGAGCGVGGYFVECLGGYLSGYNYTIGEIDDYGLWDAGVDTKKIKIITIANKDGKIVGIYPGAGIRNLPYIMRNHKDLVSEGSFKACSDQLPQIWK